MYSSRLFLIIAFLVVLIESRIKLVARSASPVAHAREVYDGGSGVL